MFKETVLHFYNSANVPLCPCPDIQQAHELIASLRLPDVRVTFDNFFISLFNIITKPSDISH